VTAPETTRPRVAPKRGRGPLPAVGATAAVALLFFLFLPVAALFVTTGPGALWEGLRQPPVGPALLLSLRTTALTLVLIVGLGTPLAYWLARTDSRLAGVVGALCRLPIVIPPAVAGLALLRAFGRRGLFGAGLHAAGIDVPFTEAAVVMAQMFVAAPFFVEAGTSAFAAIDPRLLAVARTLGASPARLLFRVALPLARRGLIAGAAMAWARALGEFGATLMFAGNLTGRTQTLPLAIYTAMESDLRAAQALAVVLVLVAFALLALLRGRDLLPQRRAPP
jgi:molybdate transport system permease protein